MNLIKQPEKKRKVKWEWNVYYLGVHTHTHTVPLTYCCCDIETVISLCLTRLTRSQLSLVQRITFQPLVMFALLARFSAPAPSVLLVSYSFRCCFNRIHFGPSGLFVYYGIDFNIANYLQCVHRSGKSRTRMPQWWWWSTLHAWHFVLLYIFQ